MGEGELGQSDAISGRNANSPVLITAVPPPSSSRFNFRLPTPSPFTPGMQGMIEEK